MLMINYSIPPFEKKCSRDKPQEMGLVNIFIQKMEKEINSM